LERIFKRHIIFVEVFLFRYNHSFQKAVVNHWRLRIYTKTWAAKEIGGWHGTCNSQAEVGASSRCFCEQRMISFKVVTLIPVPGPAKTYQTVTA